MRALVCTEYGPPENLVIRELPPPEPGPGQVCIEVRAAGLNFPDLLMIAGEYQLKTPPPFVPGAEVAGIVTATGKEVTRFKPGDEVIAMPLGGAFAEVCVADEAATVPKPADLDFEEAAGFAITYFTGMHALRQSARLAEGETVLVLGAAGGVGSAAVELARAMGARVIAAASSAEKLEFTKALGADATIDYSTEPLNDAVKRLTDGKGVDVVFDPVGGELAQHYLGERGVAICLNAVAQQWACVGHEQPMTICIRSQHPWDTVRRPGSQGRYQPWFMVEGLFADLEVVTICIG